MGADRAQKDSQKELVLKSMSAKAAAGSVAAIVWLLASVLFALMATAPLNVPWSGDWTLALLNSTAFRIALLVSGIVVFAACCVCAFRHLTAEKREEPKIKRPTRKLEEENARSQIVTDILCVAILASLLDVIGASCLLASGYQLTLADETQEFAWLFCLAWLVAVPALMFLFEAFCEHSFKVALYALLSLAALPTQWLGECVFVFFAIIYLFIIERIEMAAFHRKVEKDRKEHEQKAPAPSGEGDDDDDGK